MFVTHSYQIAYINQLKYVTQLKRIILENVHITIILCHAFNYARVLAENHATNTLIYV